MTTMLTYLLASGQLNEDGEPEVDMDDLQVIMDAVKAKNIAFSVATNDLRLSLEQLRDAVNAILEGLA